MAGATIFNPVSGTTSNWLASALSDIQASQSSGGILGALGAASSTQYQPGSIAEFLNSAPEAAFSSITTNNTLAATQLAIQISDANKQAASAAAAQKALDALSAVSDMVLPKNVLDPVIYFDDGTTIDTNSNILTKPDGSQFDTVTGAPYTDPASIMQLANGAYLNTSTNIMTMPDGTRIDMVTGLLVSTSA